MRRIILLVFSVLITGLCIWQIELRVSATGVNSTIPAREKSADSENRAGAASGTLSPGNGASQFPLLNGRVVDNASMLNASEKTELENKLAAFEAKSSDQVVVATLPALGGNNLEDYANRLFRHWQLGQAEENNGVLLLIVRDDRKMRIEVGYGLEGTLTDALSKIIIEQVIVPNFRAGDFGKGIVEGADMITRVLSGDLAELEARKERQNTRDYQAGDFGFWIVMILWGLLFFGPFAFALLAPVFGKKTGKKRYRWLGIEMTFDSSSSGGSSGGGWSGGSSGGGFSGGGGSSGGGGASGGW